MKRLFLMTGMTILPLATVHAAPEIYGKAFLTTDYSDIGVNNNGRQNRFERTDSDFVQINSNFSRLGIRGSEALTDDTEIIYRLEYGTQIDGSGDSAFNSRDTYLGVKNKNIGELRVGRNTSVLGYAYDPMVARAYWDNLGKTTLDSNNTVSALNMLDYTRKNNSIVWIAPKFETVPVDLVMQYATNENSDDRGAGFGAYAKYSSNKGITTGLAFSRDIEANGSINALDFATDKNVDGQVNYGGDVIRGTMTLDIDHYIDMKAPITLGAVYQQADYDFEEASIEKGLIVSANMHLKQFAHPASVYLQYNQTDNLNGIGNNESKQMVLGGEYEFKDNIIAHAYIGQNSTDYTNPMDETREVADIKVVAAGGGLEYLF
ncbi:porin [Psychrobacter sp. JB385]|uniref:porin n=1 Tax=Psychrobacter sp. JB385 TaxID=1434841 RepID=UPI00097F15F6|nr:porin [Psychrobacter sp. JB385]SJN17878.1 outer membrane porin, putative [Psychrobacter sp. JB385]